MKVLRRKTRSTAQVEHDIRHVLADLRPLLNIEECGLDLATFDAATGEVVLGINGGCPDCEVSAATFLKGIETRLRHTVSEVKSVRIA